MACPSEPPPELSPRCRRDPGDTLPPHPTPAPSAAQALPPCPKLQFQAPPDAVPVWDGFVWEAQPRTHHTSLCPLRSKRVHRSESAYATTRGASQGRALPGQSSRRARSCVLVCTDKDEGLF